MCISVYACICVLLYRADTFQIILRMFLSFQAFYPHLAVRSLGVANSYFPSWMWEREKAKRGKRRRKQEAKEKKKGGEAREKEEESAA